MNAAWAVGLLVGINLIRSGWAIVTTAFAGRSVARAVGASAAVARS